MSEKLKIENKDITGSQFRHLNMSGTVFEDIDLSGAKFFDINLRGADIGAVDFGGASFSCMNTGEDRPRRPVVFKKTKIVNCDLTGMTIDGVLVTDLLKAYKKTKLRP